ncbi:hypothetical protein BKA82DRAFT_390183 [Pisolithus tinctorius]|uniref:Uncharacterized protein n=1 Tax=Pisolithus tinctorius Marx 270 TaxID=870435 RepID=A0A0C3KDA6_PISTI|nr:hypothetical protein BKA82DRAFT_390183 [Pisolithus tinctorius]KIO07612.1 hypothetical protein M404DRAFT_390183 [Pisolithus tinctorius Marx 270]
MMLSSRNQPGITSQQYEQSRYRTTCIVNSMFNWIIPAQGLSIKSRKVESMKCFHQSDPVIQGPLALSGHRQEMPKLGLVSTGIQEGSPLRAWTALAHF